MSTRATIGLWWPLNTPRYPVYVEWEMLDGCVYFGIGQSERYRWRLFNSERHPRLDSAAHAICRMLGG